MELQINEEFMEICQQILTENKSASEWSEIESGDMFQTNLYCGGFESLDQAFWFSYYDESQNEFWFQLTLDEIAEIITGKKRCVTMKSPER